MTLLIALMIGCSSAPVPHDHGPDGHDHGAEAPVHEANDGKATKPESTLHEAKIGKGTARLESSADGLRLVVLDASGAAVAAEGEARVVLTGTGEAPQRVLLAADDEAWTGAAKAEGAPGYIAVVSVNIDGAQETARITWGKVPEPKAAPAKVEHGHDEGGHDHGDGGHAH